MNVHQWVVEAYSRIKNFVRETPLEYSPYLSTKCDCNVYLKLENQQVTGSFKARGALNKILSLSGEEKKKGVITASTGNHAAAVSNALAIADITGEIYMPENVSALKVQNLKQFSNVTIKLYGQDSVDTEREALRLAGLQDKVYVSPYNDEKIIGGQGTVAYEILKQQPEVKAIFVPVGGGGLISGIGGYAKEENADIEIIGCQPVNSAVMYHSVQAGKILDMPSLPTISDGTAGGIEEGALTLPICQKYVDDYYLVEEPEILSALGILLKHHQIMAEGAAGLSVAALIKNKARYKHKNVVLILCGNKMSLELLQSAIDTQA
ncbi:MAG: threonine/serine dehydratase [Bacteroidetes bacterium]|nr:MAG: threonine/serine dehydratase [Bacteroidota bacterium]